MMRLFIALALPATVRAELAATQIRLHGHPVRWADPVGLHLTLQFLGEAAETLVPPLLSALAAIPTEPFSLTFGGVGRFPNLGQPRTIWVGLGGDTTALSRLYEAVITATAPFGFAPDVRGFKPHLTLGRARQGAAAAQLDALGEALTHVAPPAPLVWVADRPVLFASSLTPQGVVYTRLGGGGF